MNTCMICGRPEDPSRYALKHTTLALACMGTDVLCVVCYVWVNGWLSIFERRHHVHIR